MTDNRTTELLPCPICGGQPDFQHFNITPNVQGRIICACGLSLVQGKNDTDDDMRIIWNTRSDYAVQAANERKAEQAIAATLGDDGYRQAAEYWKGMYEELLTERIGEERDYPEHDGRYECPECGNVVYYDELHGGGWTIYVEDYQIPLNCCPNCGRAVKR